MAEHDRKAGVNLQIDGGYVARTLDRRIDTIRHTILKAEALRAVIVRPALSSLSDAAAAGVADTSGGRATSDQTIGFDATSEEARQPGSAAGATSAVPEPGITNDRL
jgi:hypothetical protein